MFQLCLTLTKKKQKKKYLSSFTYLSVCRVITQFDNLIINMNSISFRNFVFFAFVIFFIFCLIINLNSVSLMNFVILHSSSFLCLIINLNSVSFRELCIFAFFIFFIFSGIIWTIVYVIILIYSVQFNLFLVIPHFNFFWNYLDSYVCN